jgi:hypothetical protein
MPGYLPGDQYRWALRLGYANGRNLDALERERSDFDSRTSFHRSTIMTEIRSDDSETTGIVATFVSSERDQADGVTRWMISNFQPQLADAVRSTPFTVPLLCAIACREAGLYWLPLTSHKPAAEVLGLMVYDASGDVAGAPRSAFPVNTAEFRLHYGDAFTSMLVDEANAARAARGLNPARIVYKGYGIFQYDLQFVRTDEDFFRAKKWYSFAECVGRAVKELKRGFDATGDIHDAVRAYNGSGPRAEQYARDVMRLLPFCEEAAASAPGPLSVITGFRAEPAAARFVESSGASGRADDPALPADDEVNETADFETARLFANLGAPSAADPLPFTAATFAASAATGFDLARAKAFLQACMTSHPRVTYGLGSKPPFHGAIPGRDFRKIDCSGFVREAIRLATNPSVPFPDGSVVQHDWVRAHGFEKSTIAAGGESDGVVRIAFLRPQDSPHHIGHVVLVAGGRTLESHGGVGPDSRPWDGRDWQAKAFVYVLARDAQFGTVTVQSSRTFQPAILAAQPLAARIVVPHPHLAHIAEHAAPATATNGASMSAPAIIQGRENAVANMFSNVFSSDQLPTHHDGLLVVKMRTESMISGPAMALSAMSMEPTTAGLSALSFFERAGMIKRIVPLRKPDASAAPAPRFSATAMMMVSSRPIQEADASAGVRFIELEPGQDTQQLHTALANDPNVLSVSKVPVRYLTLPAAARKPAPRDEVGIEATPPDASILWNLQKIRWEEARGRPDFHEAQDVRVAVLDTGVDSQHPDLTVDSYHWQQPDLSSVSDKDIIGHGTHVSGTIAALINSSVSVKGVCRCRLSVWKIFDDEPTYAPGLGAFVYFVNPIMYRRALAACVDDPVDVINLSIGGRGAPDATEQSLFDQLIASGVTICAAMGNEREQNSPTSYPAAIPGVIAVGATGLDDRVTNFSNRGSHIAVTAPGKAIWSTLPTYSGQTAFGAVFGPNGSPKLGMARRRETNYDAWDGTSMATPHVSGCAALLIAKGNAAGNKLRPDQVRQSLMASADKVSEMNGEDFNSDYGAGRINLLKLLQ